MIRELFTGISPQDHGATGSTRLEEDVKVEKYIGVVKHYYNHLGVAVVSLSDEIKLNDVVHVQGHTTDFCQKVRSIEVNHHQIETSKPNKDVAMKVIGPVRRGDKIYLAPDAEPTETKEYPEQRIDEWDR